MRCAFSPASTACLLILRFYVGHAVAHYEQPPCQHDEVQGEVLGASGYTCSPRCEESTFNCPADMPPGASAQPQCMLQDVDKGAFCGLLCQVDAQCPSGAQCKQMSQMGVGLCMYAASFADWARSATTRKLALGWPNKGGSLASFQVAKTFQALQSLKSKYSIDDGDVDMLTLKELLNSIAPNSASAAGIAGQTKAASGASASPDAAGGLSSMVSHDVKVWTNDLNRLGSELSQGLPGIESEVQKDLYYAEHLNERYAAQSLLRVIVIFAVIYLAVGSFVKYQMTGASGKDVIPHVGFWTEYPQLVMDGVTYSKLLIDGAMGKTSTARGFDDLSGGLDGSIRGASLGRGGGAGAFEAL
eukprot:gb/GFBE01025941.1/.p1 GENE.gb/GFBE01025941.1/~~gb/GFBE01025941.1/.p1  ORF type:complete len:358 (+),score=77.77 gb/GFBE01025941.1/:1-1074(+)